MKKFFTITIVLVLLLSSVTALADYGAILKRDTFYYRDSALKNSVSPLFKYTAVAIRNVDHGKAEITLDGESFWISSKHLVYPWKDILKKYYGNGTESYDDTGLYAKRTCYIYDYPDDLGLENQKSKVKKSTKFHACGEKNGWVMVIDLDERFYGYIKSSNLGSYGFGDNSKSSELYVNYFKVWPFK